MRRNFFTVIFLFLLSSCYKKKNDTGEICTSGCTVIQGRVTTLNDQPVPDVTIKIRSHRSTSYFSGITRNIAETKSGPDGQYTLKFLLNEYESGADSFADVYFQYSYNEAVYTPLSGSSKDVVISSPQSGRLFTTREVTVNKYIYLPLKSKAKIRLQGFYTSGSDYNSFTVMPAFKIGLFNSYMNGALLVGAQSALTEQTVDVAGDEITLFHIEKLKNGQRTLTDTAVFTPLGQTTNLVLDF